MLDLAANFGTKSENRNATTENVGPNVESTSGSGGEDSQQYWIKD